jgi:hypothetical protein
MYKDPSNRFKDLQHHCQTAFLSVRPISGSKKAAARPFRVRAGSRLFVCCVGIAPGLPDQETATEERKNDAS